MAFESLRIVTELVWTHGMNYGMWVLKECEVTMRFVNTKDKEGPVFIHETPRNWDLNEGRIIIIARVYFANKGLSSQGYGFSSGHVWTWELDCEESWLRKNWCFWTVVLEKTLESPLDCKEIQPVHPRGDQSRVFIGRTDAEAETPVLWSPHAQSWLIGKDPDAGKDWRQEEKRTTEDEMAGWHHQLDEHKFEWTPGVGDGQGGLACCDSWGCKELYMTARLNWTELNWGLRKEGNPLFWLACPQRLQSCLFHWRYRLEKSGCFRKSSF